jgi:hypothetical protein
MVVASIDMVDVIISINAPHCNSSPCAGPGAHLPGLRERDCPAAPGK